MPAKSERQRKYMAAEWSRMKHGKKSKSGIAMEDAHDFMKKPFGKLGKKSREDKGEKF